VHHQVQYDVRKTLIIDMVMVEGVAMGVFLFFCLMRSCAISLFYFERLQQRDVHGYQGGISSCHGFRIM
jgi:hypothetical protein